MSALDASDPMITVATLREDGTQERKEMRASEAWKRIDFTKNYQLCRNRICRHDISLHAGVKNYKVEIAGKCQVHNCKCRHYKLGELVSQRELDEALK